MTDTDWTKDLMEIQPKAEAADEEEFEYPKYSDKGDIIFEVLGEDETKVYRWHIEDVAYCGGSTFYVQEGVGIKYFVDWMGDDRITGPGFYTFVGVHGRYLRGDGWTTDDDEDWEFDDLRPATPEEIEELK